MNGHDDPRVIELTNPITDSEDEVLKLPRGVDRAMVANMIVGAIEGGSNYWAEGLYLTRSGRRAELKPWYSDPAIYRPGLLLDMVVRDEIQHKFLTFDDFAKGLRKMKKEAPRHWKNWIDENDDAETADVMLQFVAFGEIVYG